MRHGICRALTLLVIWVCALLGARADESGVLSENDFWLDGRTLAVRDGIETMGYTVEDNLPNHVYSVSGDTLSQYSAAALRLPDSLRVLDGESLVDLTLDELVIPSGVEQMYECCFVGVRVKRLTVLSTAVTLTPSILSGIVYDEIILPQDGAPCCARDGVIFSADMRTLLSYPPWREETHYDVPAGVREIGEYAFSGCTHLQTVSLPIGLTSVGRGAFLACGRLQAISLPLTVSEIGRYAFADCVSLCRVSLPASFACLLPSAPASAQRDAWNAARPANETGSTPYADTLFDNCPALRAGGAYQGDNGATSQAGFDPARYEVLESRYVHVIANPDSVSGHVTAYAREDGTGAARGRIACGTALNAVIPAVTWQDITRGDTPRYAQIWPLDADAYIDLSSVVIAEDYSDLFAYAAITPSASTVTLYESCATNASAQRVRRRDLENCDDMYAMSEGLPWVFIGAWNGHEHISGYAFIGDMALTRAWTGDARVYGIVQADSIANRVHLRKAASRDSQSLGKYFSGTQLEVLGEQGGFYHVRILDQTGYIMKAYARVVPQADEGD